MISDKELDRLIEHYQTELWELFSLQQTLDNSQFVKKYNAENIDLTEIKDHIKYLLFFMSCFLDILISLKVLYNTKLDWERKFHLSNGFVTIYEATKTFNKHQKRIRPFLDQNYKHLNEEYNSISIKLKEFKVKYNYDSVISNFRNKAGAHYDENFIDYINNLNAIDKPSSVIAIKEFGDILDSLLVFWNKIIEELYKKLTA